MTNVYILGDINADISTDLAAYPTEGDDSEITRLTWCSGGAGANTATALALLGAQVRLLGRVGDDPAAAIALRAASNAGVDTALVQQDNAVATGTCIAAISPNGQRTFLSFRGANVQLDGSDWDANTFNRHPALHVCAHALLAEPQQQAALRAIDLARHNGSTVSLDLCIPTIRIQPALLGAILPLITFLFMNEDELHLLLPGLGIESALQQLIIDGVPLVALKRGAMGCTVMTAHEKLDLEALPVVARDTNGCGDAFAAGFVWASLNGGSLLECAALANMVGGLTATRGGAADALPNRAELRAAIGQYPTWIGSALVERLVAVAESSE